MLIRIINGAKMLMTKSPQCEAAMSDNSDNSDDKSSFERGDDICRDFLRNVCKRGKRCKYRHPDVSEARELGRQREYTFCHDFQNAGCRRSSCKFIHCTREEEECYKQTGQLPVRLQQAAALGIGVLPNALPLLRGEVPICKDFLKGECKRSARCKYRHLSSLEYEYELRKNTPYRSPTVSTYDYSSFSENNFEKYDNGYEQVTQVTAPAPAPTAPAPAPTVTVPPAAKRRRTEFEENNFETNGFDTFRFTVRTPGDYRLLEEENTMLRRKVEELKKQMSDLAATNEVLLEQNAGYHRASKNNVVTTGPPVVTVSQVVTPTITPAPSVARPGIGVPHPLCTATLKQITLTGNTELIMSQQALQSHLAAADLTAQPASMAPPTLNPGSIVPVSINMETITGSIASLAPPIVSLPRTSIPQAQIISGISTPMISYPIMSHSSQLPSSSLG